MRPTPATALSSPISKGFVVRGNVSALPLATDSIDLVITSPPYFAFRSYRDAGEHYADQVGAEPTPEAYVDSLIAATEEMARVCKPEGSIFVNLGDKYAGSGGHNNAGFGAPLARGPGRYTKSTIGGARSKSLMGLPWRYANRVVDELGLILRAEIIWSKNAMPDPHHDRVQRTHETWFHFVQHPTYFESTDAIREPYTESSVKRMAAGFSRETGWWSNAGRIAGDGATLDKEPDHAVPNEKGRLPGSVWTIGTDPLRIPAWASAKWNLPEHYAAFPPEWPRRLILGWCPPSGVVLDPFGGSGTVAMVARTLDRVGISLDLSFDYSRLARWRIEQSGGGGKVLSRTWHERQGGLDL